MYKRKSPGARKAPREKWKTPDYRLNMKNLIAFNPTHAPLSYDAWRLSTGFDGEQFSLGRQLVESANWDEACTVHGKIYAPPRIVDQRMYNNKKRKSPLLESEKQYNDTEFDIYVCRQNDPIMCSFHALNNVLEQRLFSPALYAQILSEVNAAHGTELALEHGTSMPQIESDVVCYAARRLGIFLAPIYIDEESETLLGAESIERFLRECGSFFALTTSKESSNGHYFAARYVEKLTQDPDCAEINDCWLLINSFPIGKRSFIKPYYQSTKRRDAEGKKTGLVQKLVQELRSDNQHVHLLVPLSPELGYDRKLDAPCLAQPTLDAQARVMLACCYKPGTSGDLSLSELYKLLLPPNDTDSLHPECFRSTSHEARHEFAALCSRALESLALDDLAYINRVAILALSALSSNDDRLALHALIYACTLCAPQDLRVALSPAETQLMCKAFRHLVHARDSSGFDILEVPVRKIIQCESRTPVLEVCQALFERSQETLGAIDEFMQKVRECCEREDYQHRVWKFYKKHTRARLKSELLDFMFEHFVSIHPDDWRESRELRKRPEHLQKIPNFDCVAMAKHFADVWK